MCLCHPSRVTDYGTIVPIHLVADPTVLLKNGNWDLDRLEDVIGKPREYPTHTVRLFLVAPEMSTGALKIDELEAMLTPYASTHDLSVKITYYPNPELNSGKVYINYDQDGSAGRQRVSIDIVGEEAITGFEDFGMPITRTILKDMHLHHYVERTIEDPFDFEAHVGEWLITTSPEADTEYDFNFLRVHRTRDDESFFTDFKVIIPTARS
jgi:hypothetical protein